MSAPAHTPGPWWVREPGEVTVLGWKEHTRHDGAIDRYEGEVARIQPQIRKGERRANALLVAAAPEMFEALSELTKAAALSDSATPRLAFEAILDDAVSKARAALAKASPSTPSTKA